MTQFGLVAPPLRGHLDPFTALGLALARRGHSVTLFSDAASAPPHPIRFAPVATRQGTAAFEARMAGVTGLSGLGPMIAAMAERAEDLCRALPAALAANGIEALLVDQTEPAGALAARQLGLPYASIGTALPLNREDGVPPPYVGWRHAPDGRRDWLNRGGYRIVDWLMRPLSLVLRRRAAALGLQPVQRMEDLFSDRLQIMQCIQGFDYPRRERPPQMHYCGPIRRIGPDGRAGENPPDGLEGAGAPLVFCSLGTIQGHRIEIFEAAAHAVAERGMRLLAVCCGRLSQAQKEHLARLPGRPLVRDFVDQRQVLALAHAAIVHGGFNTVLDALEAGVPAIAVPLAFEQGAIAARLAHSGAGLVVPLRQVGRGIGPALGQLEPCRPAARRLGQEIAQSGGTAAAVRLIEAMAGQGAATRAGEALA